MKKESAGFKSTHNLAFKIAKYPIQLVSNVEWIAFKIGTCEGLFCFNGVCYQILAINNKEMNNGHFQDVLDWFENSCKRDKVSLQFLQIMNKRFKKHLVEKRGFVLLGDNTAEKSFSF